MSQLLHQRLAAELAKREATGTRRHLCLPSSGRVDFSSNDYLGLSRHPAVQAAAQQAVAAGAGSTGSRLLTGNSAAAEALETQLALFHRAEAALLFNSGYVANLGFFAALPRRGDTILYDEASHASVKEGIRASFATAWSFRHHDLADLGAQAEPGYGHGVRGRRVAVLHGWRPGPAARAGCLLPLPWPAPGSRRSPLQRRVRPPG
jgi:8-amino-7-oxononanoate synthase